MICQLEKETAQGQDENALPSIQLSNSPLLQPIVVMWTSWSSSCSPSIVAVLALAGSLLILQTPSQGLDLWVILCSLTRFGWSACLLNATTTTTTKHLWGVALIRASSLHPVNSQDLYLHCSLVVTPELVHVVSGILLLLWIVCTIIIIWYYHFNCHVGYSIEAHLSSKQLLPAIVKRSWSLSWIYTNKRDGAAVTTVMMLPGVLTFHVGVPGLRSGCALDPSSRTHF